MDLYEGSRKSSVGTLSNIPQVGSSRLETVARELVAIPFWVPLLAALVCGIYEFLSVRTVPPLKDTSTASYGRL